MLGEERDKVDTGMLLEVENGLELPTGEIKGPIGQPDRVLRGLSLFETCSFVFDLDFSKNSASFFSFRNQPYAQHII